MAEYLYIDCRRIYKVFIMFGTIAGALVFVNKYYTMITDKYIITAWIEAFGLSVFIDLLPFEVLRFYAKM